MGHTRYSGLQLKVEKMDTFTCGLADKVIEMTDFAKNDWFADQQRNIDPVFDDLTADDDVLMEQILDNMNSTPIGQVLKEIASLPDVSRAKILRVRRQLTEGKYDLNERLDMALEKVLDEIDV
ncbi:MAG: hypothetical protein ABSG82_01665 [Sedimentisphaerales bacterium]|jgi:hypothetical protein